MYNTICYTHTTSNKQQAKSKNGESGVRRAWCICRSRSAPKM
jgi:hypothetical protein